MSQRASDVGSRGIVLAAPGMEEVQVRRDLPYGEGVHAFDRRPRGMGAFGSWARLLAVSGLAAVVYSNARPAADLAALLAALRRDAGTLGIDPRRLGLWACSGGLRQMDSKPARRESRRTEHRRESQR